MNALFSSFFSEKKYFSFIDMTLSSSLQLSQSLFGSWLRHSLWSVFCLCFILVFRFFSVVRLINSNIQIIQRPFHFPSNVQQRVVPSFFTCQNAILINIRGDFFSFGRQTFFPSNHRSWLNHKSMRDNAKK